MEIETFYLGCLSHASYLVHDEASKTSDDPAHHEEAARLIERMMASQSSLSRAS